MGNIMKLTKMSSNNLTAGVKSLGFVVTYTVPISYEYSECHTAQYDIVAERIYRLSAARAFLSLLSLSLYDKIRQENGSVVAKYVRLNVDKESASFPPFIPFADGHVNNQKISIPIKAPYARRFNKNLCNKHVYAAKINIPYVQYSYYGSASLV